MGIRRAPPTTPPSTSLVFQPNTWPSSTGDGTLWFEWEPEDAIVAELSGPASRHTYERTVRPIGDQGASSLGLTCRLRVPYRRKAGLDGDVVARHSFQCANDSEEPRVRCRRHHLAGPRRRREHDDLYDSQRRPADAA